MLVLLSVLLGSRLLNVIHFALVFVEFDLDFALVRVYYLDHRLLSLTLTFSVYLLHFLLTIFFAVPRYLALNLLRYVPLNKRRSDFVWLLRVRPLRNLVKTLMLVDRHGSWLLHKNVLSIIIEIFLRRLLLLLQR